MAGQVWLTNSLGGYMYSDSLSKVLRQAVQPLCKFRQFADVKDAAVQGKGKGDTFHWNVYSDIATQGTGADRRNGHAGKQLYDHAGHHDHYRIR